MCNYTHVYTQRHRPHTCSHSHTHTRAHTHSSHAYTHSHVHARVRAHTASHTQTHTHTGVCTRAHTQPATHRHTLTRARVHRHTNTFPASDPSSDPSGSFRLELRAVAASAWPPGPASLADAPVRSCTGSVQSTWVACAQSQRGPGQVGPGVWGHPDATLGLRLAPAASAAWPGLVTAEREWSSAWSACSGPAATWAVWRVEGHGPGGGGPSWSCRLTPCYGRPQLSVRQRHPHLGAESRPRLWAQAVQAALWGPPGQHALWSAHILWSALALWSAHARALSSCRPGITARPQRVDPPSPSLGRGPQPRPGPWIWMGDAGALPATHTRGRLHIRRPAPPCVDGTRP